MVRFSKVNGLELHQMCVILSLIFAWQKASLKILSFRGVVRLFIHWLKCVDPALASVLIVKPLFA